MPQAIIWASSQILEFLSKEKKSYIRHSLNIHPLLHLPDPRVNSANIHKGFKATDTLIKHLCK